MDTRCSAKVLWGTAALVIGAGSAVAQEREAGPQEQAQLEEITVTAPWLVRREVVGRTTTGAQLEEITLTRRVDYSDLDLTRTEDAQELERRIDQAARESCDVLAEEFPLADTDTRTCVENARGGAMGQARQAIDAAVSEVAVAEGAAEEEE